MDSEITSEEYEQVLKYMEATNEQDFQAATRVMQQYGFNLNTAINAKFNGTNLRPELQQNFGQQMERDEQHDQQIVRKFIKHVQKQNKEWSALSYGFNFVKNLTIGLVKFVGQIIRTKYFTCLVPEVILKRIIRSNFYVMYRENVHIDFVDQKLNHILLKTKQISHKACFLVISPPNIPSPSLINLLKKQDVINKINQSFMFAGFVTGEDQLKQIPNQNAPQIVICRFNIYKEVDIVERFVGQDAINQITVQKLNLVSQQCRNHHKRDKNVIIKYRNFLRRSYYGPMIPVEQEEEEINFVARQETSHHIQEQNYQYKKIEQETLQKLQQEKKRKAQEELERHKLEEKIQERKCRKMSIPDEPQEGEIIRFVFRCPDGTTKVRNFNSDEEIELIYNWIETNQEIQLEDNQKRQFEVMYNYPPQCLKQMKHKKMKDVFESDQEKLLIREL